MITICDRNEEENSKENIHQYYRIFFEGREDQDHIGKNLDEK
jgi:hypothetical protein